MADNVSASIILLRAQRGEPLNNIELDSLQRAVNALTARHFLNQWNALESLLPVVDVLESRREAVLKSEKAKELASTKFEGPYTAIEMPPIQGRLRSASTLTFVIVKKETWEPVGVSSFSQGSLAVCTQTKMFTDKSTDTVYRSVEKIVTFEEGWAEYRKHWPAKKSSSWSWRGVAEVVGVVAIIALLVSRRRPALPSPALGDGTMPV